MGSGSRNAFCSFCRKSYKDAGPLVEGPGEVYICSDCIALCHHIIEQEKKRRGTVSETSPREEDDWLESLHKYFLERVTEKHWNPEELALLKEIGVKMGELRTLVGRRANR